MRPPVNQRRAKSRVRISYFSLGGSLCAVGPGYVIRQRLYNIYEERIRARARNSADPLPEVWRGWHVRHDGDRAVVPHAKLHTRTTHNYDNFAPDD